MLFFSESEYIGNLKKQVTALLGKKRSIKEQIRLGFVGSNRYRMVKMRINGEYIDVIDSNTRCTFEKFENGLLLRINNKQKLFHIAIAYAQIDKVEIVKGNERISPIFFSPMKILLLIGVPVRYARYFRVWASEYSIEPMKLLIKSGSDIIELDSNGYNYFAEARYFKDFLNNKEN